MAAPTRPPLYSIALLSASALCYEMLLMRLLSIIQWHHFAYMIIGLALLGYGMSGTVVALTQQWLIKRFTAAYLTLLVLFGCSSLGIFCLAQWIPFNGEELLWNPMQLVYLLLLFLLLSIPFFFAASAICLSFRQYGGQIGTLYAFDLAGAGAGSLILPGLLMVFFARHALVVVSLCGLLAAVIAAWELQTIRRQAVTAGLVGLAVSLVVAGLFIELRLSPYKSLAQHLRIPGTRILAERSSPLGLITVMESTVIPLRHVPGLGLLTRQEPQEQLGLFTDGDNLSVVTRQADDLKQLRYLDQTVTALPYHLKKNEATLILGAGGGSDILLARLHGAGPIDAVELNPQIIELLRGPLADFAGPLLDDNTSQIHTADIRGFVLQTRKRYDLIQLALIDAFTPSASGLYALHENYLYTVEALEAYLRLLTPNGMLAITRWIKNPPRDTLKLMATAVRALERRQAGNPANRLALIRSWQAGTLLIKNSDFTAAELRKVEAFCEQRAFDIAYHPAVEPEQVNRYNLLRQPYFYRAAMALTGEQSREFIDAYKFNIEPATDNRPYFHHFFKWSSLKELVALRRQGSIPLFETGYLILIATLALSSVMGLVLILLPLKVFSKKPPPGRYRPSNTRIVFYFFVTGLAFLFIEIAFMQRFILFLHHPVYAITTSLAAFLVFAGLGSRWSQPLANALGPHRALLAAVAGIILISTLYLISLDRLFTLASNLPMMARVVASVLLIAPLAVSMGMPFPLALESIAAQAEGYVPWAWGINGCASVTSATLATLLAVHFGFTLVITLALCLYLGLLPLFPRPARPGQEGG